MEKKNLEYLAALRKSMADNSIDAVVISSTDPHQSELPPAHWRGREWLTGFASENGTSGTAVVTKDQAYVWTDNRYFIQATEQLKGTGFSMMPEDGPNAVNLIDWLVEHLNSGQTVGIDGMTFSISYAQRLEQELNDNGMKLNDNYTPFDTIYPDRPDRPKNKIFVHDETIVGQDVNSKMDEINAQVKAEYANAVLISSLDDIAWATNLRTANDIPFSPTYLAFLYISPTERVLFVDSDKLTPEVEAHLQKYNFTVKPYDGVLEFVATLPKDVRLLLDPEKTARGIYDKVDCTPVFGGDAISKLKSIKNETMLSNLELAMEKDGVALVKFFMYVEQQYPGGQLTEMSLVKELRSLRLADPSCVDESFASIIGWNEHAALPHYEPTPETDVPIKGNGLLLVDSGGQYTYGTTDITRTVALGTPTTEQIHDFTLVLKGNIALTTIKFPTGTRGSQLDVLARQYLWDEGKAYFHGTGHGVGFFINCHEGPQSIRTQENPVTIEPGMVMSNEPGLYLEGRYGIRCENMMACEVWKTTEFGQFLQFRVMTLFPFDTTLLDPSMMTQQEIDWLNAYQAKVRTRLTPLLTPEEAAWLEKKTQPISK